MRLVRALPFATALGLLAGVQAFAQTPSDPTQHSQGSAGVTKQKTQGELPMVGPASGAYKQHTQGTLPMVGPASGAYKQNSQAMAHSDTAQGMAK